MIGCFFSGHRVPPAKDIPAIHCICDIDLLHPHLFLLQLPPGPVIIPQGLTVQGASRKPTLRIRYDMLFRSTRACLQSTHCTPLRHSSCESGVFSPRLRARCLPMLTQRPSLREVYLVPCGSCFVPLLFQEGPSGQEGPKGPFGPSGREGPFWNKKEANQDPQGTR